MAARLDDVAPKTVIAPGAGVRRWSAAYVSALIIVFATVSWRPNALYSGGLDSVVMAKALLTVIALSIAWYAHEQRRSRQPIRTLPAWFLLGYLAIATFGAYSTGDVFPSLVLAVRVVIVAVIVVVLARTYPIADLLDQWFGAVMTVGLVAAFTGLPSIASGRLRGGIPALNPNEVATLCGLSSIWLGARVLRGVARPRQVALLLLLLGFVWASGSRTSLMAVVVAFVVMLPQARRLRPSAVIGLVAAAGAAVYAALATDILGSFFGRGGTQSLTTLSSRTVAWSAAFSYSDSSWVRFMGAGLAKKEIPVQGQYWQTQVLDSSWMSALVQAGRVGVVLLALWVLWLMITALTGRPRWRMLCTALIAFILVRSFLESGLVDSTPTFVTFFLLSLLAARPVGPAPRQPAFVPQRAGLPMGLPGQEERLRFARWPATSRADLGIAAIDTPAPADTPSQVESPPPADTPPQVESPPPVESPLPDAVAVVQPEEPSAGDAPLDLNAADASALRRLPGIGPAMAAAIVAHREAIGRFESVEQLSAVRGVGPARMTALRALVRV